MPANPNLVVRRQQNKNQQPKDSSHFFMEKVIEKCVQCSIDLDSNVVVYWIILNDTKLIRICVSYNFTCHLLSIGSKRWQMHGESPTLFVNKVKDFCFQHHRCVCGQTEQSKYKHININKNQPRFVAEVGMSSGVGDPYSHRFILNRLCRFLLNDMFIYLEALS